MPGKFVHLHAHSHYSLLSALPKIPELVAAAAKEEMPALALTDAGNLYGAIEFYKECRERGVKPIIGLDAYVACRGRRDREPRIDSKRFRLVLLAENATGYRNLLALVTRSHLEGFYYKPRVDSELLAEHAAGLIAVLPVLGGEVAEALREGAGERAKEVAERYARLFGPGNVFLEVTTHPEIERHAELRERIASFGSERGIPLLAAHEIYYIKPEDRRARDALTRIQTGADASERLAAGEADFSFPGSEAMRAAFRDIPEAVANALAVAERATLELSLGAWVFPDFPLPAGRTPEDELRRLAEEGIRRRGLRETRELRERIDYELSIIRDKKFSPYFLVVADLLAFARERGILTTTRGSAAGSVVSYLAGITNVDPIAYKLPFERFLNPERPKAPDIDMDFADNRRDEVIEYARRKYGEDRVAQIGTFGTMMARAAVRDIARALGHPYGVGDRIARLIPFGSQGFPMTIDKALEMVPELKAAYRKERETKEIIDFARKIEGCARHISVHAAGVVIAPTPLTDWTPLQLDPKGGKLITQYDMYAITDEYGGVGLLKFDFLGIRNLAILADSVERARARRGVSIDIENVPLDDPKTFAMLARGETMGLFQLSGAGMTRYLKDLKPSTIHDINAMVALYRPGPMESIPAYIERKHNPALVSYLDPRMREILAESHGVITYQDDVLLIAVRIAGYNWKEADALRKAMGKKIPAEMETQREKFIAGCVERGKIPKEKAERIWKLIEPFAAYGFNKAHAASYGKVAYQTAYMKANYPVEYMAALLTAESGDIEKVAEAVAECRRMGIPVLPPDVNESFADFTVVSLDGKDAIRFGLSSVKNFGEGVARAIIEERAARGRFSSLADFLGRIEDKNLNRKSLEALVKSGALDGFAERGAMLAGLDALVAFHRDHAAAAKNQGSLFGASPFAGAAPALPAAEPASQRDRLAWEKELLGLYVSGHPLDRVREKLEKSGNSIRRVKEEVKEGMLTVVSGIVEEAKPILTKSGERMAFLKLADFTDAIEVVAFPRLYAAHPSLFAPEACISIKGRFSNRNGVPSVVAEAVKEL